MMHTACLNSSVSLRCRASRSLYFDDPTYFSDARFETNPLLISSSFTRSCCCCCCCCVGNSNSIYNSFPRINPSFLCYGLRQSNLIQFSPSKRLIVHGKRRRSCDNSSKLSSISDLDRSYYCKKLYSFKDKRRLGDSRYVCWSYEDKKNEPAFSNEIDDDYGDEVELLLDLLTEEVGLEKINVRDRKRVQKKDSSNISGRTKTVKSGYVKRDLKCDDTKSNEIRSSEKENRKLSNEGRTSVKVGNHERKKQGSSGSSYYSVSSTGEYDNYSENDVIDRDDYYVKEASSSEYKDDRKMEDYSKVHDEKLEENVEKKQSEILKKNTVESYYGNQEWRKKSEKKLNLDSSQSQHTERYSQLYSEKNDRISDGRYSQLYSEKNDRITDESKSGLKNKNSSIQKRYSDTENKLITSADELTSHHKEETTDFIRQNEYKKQSNVNLEASEIHNFDYKMASFSSSYETRMKNWQENLTTVSDRVEDQREEKHQRVDQRVDQVTSSKDSRLKSQQFSEISDTVFTNTENTSVSQIQSNIITKKQELHLESSSSSENRKNIEDNYASSQVVTFVGPGDSRKTGRKTTKASSFHVGMPKEASSSYKALKLNPEYSFQETGAHISSADEQQKSAGQFVGEFVEKAKHQLLISEGEDDDQHDDDQHELKSSDENGSGNYDEKDGIVGPSDEMWHETGASVNTVDASSNEPVKRSGRSLWNVIGDVVRLRWGPSRSETHTPKSTSSERWFSGREESSRKDGSTPSSFKDKQDSPLLSSINTNQGSSSKPMSPLVIEELNTNQGSSSSQKDVSTPSSSKEKQDPPLLILSSSSPSVPLPAIRMRRSHETNASTSGKIDQIVPKPLTQVLQPDASGSGKTVKVEPPVSSRRKLARIDQVSKDRFDEWEEAYNIEANQRKNDEFFMREALLEAKKAGDLWEVPVGAVLVHDGKIIARGYNLVEELRDSTAHAEMVCIREASNKLRSWRLSGTTLYVTLEPCPMCAGAILQARVDSVVWGAPNKLLGADGSWIRLFPDVDGGNGSDKPAAPAHPFHPNMIVRRGVLSSECADVMQQFFQLRRKKKVNKPENEPSPPPPPSSCLPITHHHNSKFVTKLHDAFSIMFCL